LENVFVYFNYAELSTTKIPLCWKVGTILKSDRNIVETESISISLKHIYICTVTSVNSGGFQLDLYGIIK